MGPLSVDEGSRGVQYGAGPQDPEAIALTGHEKYFQLKVDYWLQ